MFSASRFSRRQTLAAVFGFASALATIRSAAAVGTVTVYAAMTLRDALNEIAASCERTGGPSAKLVYGPSGTLAKQLEEGAQADIFFPADADWMGYAVAKGVIRADTRVDLLTSHLVLIAPADSRPLAVNTSDPAQISSVLGPNGRIAMCDPQAMPAGRYGKAALEATGQWSALRDRVVIADTVRSTLLFVERGEAPLGIVFDTDAAQDPAVRVIGSFPDASDKPIVYPVALTTQATKAAESFLGCIRGPRGVGVFRRLGYGVLGRGR